MRSRRSAGRIGLSIVPHGDRVLVLQGQSNVPRDQRGCCPGSEPIVDADAGL
jgi:hypothetical protein